MHDWDHNGKLDGADAFIDYQVYQSVAGQKPGGCAGRAAMLALVLLAALLRLPR